MKRVVFMTGMAGRKKKKKDLRGALFSFFFERKTVCSLKRLRLNEKFPHVLNFWKVSLRAVDKRQSGAASGSSADDTVRSILVFVRCTDSFTENSGNPSPSSSFNTTHAQPLSLSLSLSALDMPY